MAVSRYSGVGRAVLRTPDGRLEPYLLRRFLPQPSSLAQAGLVTVNANDRLDLVATRTLGDPLLAWRVADINAAMEPSTLTDTPGRVLAAPAAMP